MNSGVYNLDIYQGSTFELFLTIADGNNFPINVSGYSGIAPIKATYGAANVLDYIHVDFLSPYASGIAKLSLSPEETASLPVTQAKYELEVYQPLSGSLGTQKYMRGKVNIYPQLSV